MTGVNALVDMRGLTRSFAGRGNRDTPILAVNGVSLGIPQGATLGLVGESGCGKSTLGRMAVGLLEPDAGEVHIMGKSLYAKQEHGQYRAFRQAMCRHIQMVFQDPYSSLNPRMRILESVEEPLLCAVGMKNAAERKERSLAMLRRVGIDSGQALKFPHEFSGGQRQRIAIARAFVSEPAFVVCDEPTSSLDASIQAQILNLLVDLQEEFALTYLFISHDLAVVRHMSDHVAVMYAGMVVESAAVETFFTAPLHPYTHVLLAAATGSQASGTTADPVRVAAGCPFAPRCPRVSAVCHAAVPALVDVSKGEQAGRPHMVRCVLHS